MKPRRAEPTPEPHRPKEQPNNQSFNAHFNGASLLRRTDLKRKCQRRGTASQGHRLSQPTPKTSANGAETYQTGASPQKISPKEA